LVYSDLIKERASLVSSDMTPDKNRYFMVYVELLTGNKYIDVEGINDVYHVANLGVNVINDSIFKIKIINNNYMVGLTSYESLTDNQELIFYDISDSNNIYKITSIKNPHYNVSYRDFVIDGNYIYALAADTLYGIYIDKIDISNVTNPKIVSSKEIKGNIKGNFESRIRIVGNSLYLYRGITGTKDIEIIKKDDI